MTDLLHMRHALSLAERALGTTAPNPAVGCVIVKDERVVGRGWTQAGGRPHAETSALAEAGEAARGATAYVTLEPCAHQGQTPPCANALIQAGIARVVVAVEDPDPRVSGKGIAMLWDADIEVASGVLEREAALINQGFFLRAKEGRPLVTLKIAASLDGKTIYLVDCRFDDSIELLKQVAEWFAAHMPNVKTRIVSLSATYQKDDPKTWNEIKANGDAAIIGVGHCSNCAPAVTTHAITLETRYGVPTVALHTDKFDKVVASVARMAGLPEAPRSFVPQPVMGKTAAELAAYVSGNDPITGRPVMQEVVQALTAALDGVHAGH